MEYIFHLGDESGIQQSAAMQPREVNIVQLVVVEEFHFTDELREPVTYTYRPGSDAPQTRRGVNARPLRTCSRACEPKPGTLQLPLQSQPQPSMCTTTHVNAHTYAIGHMQAHTSQICPAFPTPRIPIRFLPPPSPPPRPPAPTAIGWQPTIRTYPFSLPSILLTLMNSSLTCSCGW